MRCRLTILRSVSDRPAFAILTMHELIDLWHVGALQVFRIPFNPTSFRRADGQVADQNGFRQMPRIAEIRHCARLVFAFASLNELPFLSLVAASYERNARQC